MTKRNIIIGAGVIVLTITGYVFRPELLFIDKTVNEEFPGGAAMASIEKGPMSLTKGNFKSLAHETGGLASIYQRANGKRILRLTRFETSNGPHVHEARGNSQPAENTRARVRERAREHAEYNLRSNSSSPWKPWE